MARVLVVVFLFAWCATASAQSSDGDPTASIQSIVLNPIEAASTAGRGSNRDYSLPSWTSTLPPLLAIALALAFRRVLLALIAGVWVGAFLLTELSPFGSFARLLDTYAVGALADRGHASILMFSLLLGGMLGLITYNGGAKGLASWVRTDRGSRRRGQLTTWFLGLLIFFDDYANSLLVGSSMRPMTDRLRISREKLAFLVDATAAPVSSLALISSWIAVEVGYIEDQLLHLGIERDAYLTFIETIPYRFYPLLMLFFVAWVAVRGRDFGPMLVAERRAVHDGLPMRPGSSPASNFHDEEVPEDVVGRPMNAVVPVLVVVVIAAVGIYVDGRAKVVASGIDPSLRNIVGEASSSAALLWASGAGCVAGLAMSLASGSLTLGGAMDAWLSGVRGMMLAALILVLAWALGDVCRDLHTAEFLIGLIGDQLAPMWIPAVVFVLAALVSFATGTSWGTMAILFPLVVPLAHQVAPGNEGILLGTISSILAGAVWGDHCSPISDTTILSSMAASCDHMDHVRTQLPYALAVGVSGLLCAEIPVAAGLYGPWMGLAISALVMIIGFELLSRPVSAR
jgi:Na+/H+ antiporter NhaC